MFDLILQFGILISFIQTSAPITNPVNLTYTLLQDGGVLMGALFVIYGQHKFYRYMIDKLEEKHTIQVEWLESQLKLVNDAYYEKAKSDNELIKELTGRLKSGE